MKVLTLFLLVLISYVSAIDLSKDKNVVAVSASNNDFGIRLYKKLVKSDQNLVCSPFSLTVLLALLAEGAESTTLTQIHTMLKYTDHSKDTIHDYYKKVMAALQSKDKYELSVANSIWIKKALTVLDTFKKQAKEVYSSEEIELDSTSAAAINKWASDHTKAKITEVIKEIDPQVMMVLVNAVYFKGTWVTKFEKTNTKKDKFKENDKNDKETDFMNVKSTFGYYEDPSLKAQVISLPYDGTESEMSMIVILPPKETGLETFESTLDYIKLNAAIDKLWKQTVIVKLPKFKITSNLDGLVDNLKSMGMTDAFDVKANFKGISTTELYVSEVAQKALIEVNEEGTVAAAVTTVEVSAKSLAVDDKVIPSFIADHPFIYLLYHKNTKTVLFIGRYTKVE